MIQKIRNFSAWHKQRLIKQVIIFFIIIACVAVLGTVAWFLRNGAFMKINEIKVYGTRMILPEDIITVIQDKGFRRGGLLGFVFPKNHRFSFKKNGELFQLIQRRFPRVEKATITRDYENRTISITITERREVVTWCIVANDESHCFWLNNEGIVIGKAPYSRGTLIPVVIDKTNETVFLGRRLIDEERLKNLIKIIEMFLEFNWVSEEIVINDALLREATITINSGQKIFISLLRSPETEGRPVLDEIVLSGKWPKIEYIDLRVESKGFYKLR